MELLRQNILPTSNLLGMRTWSENCLTTNCKEGMPCEGTSTPLVTNCKKKIPALQSILKWYRAHNHHIRDDQVYFFDDSKKNIDEFNDPGVNFNARQVSCNHRKKFQWKAKSRFSDDIGMCGAELNEIDKWKG